MPKGVYTRTPDMKTGKYVRTSEHISKLNLFQKGKTPWNKGMKNFMPKESLESMRKSKIGRVASDETRLKMSNSHKGSKSHLWRGGITMANYNIRKNILINTKYVLWRTSIFERDNYTCKECGERGCYLEVHHKIPFSVLLSDFLMAYSQFSPVEDKETLVRISDSYEPFWDLSNGITLCRKCHNATKAGRNTNVCYTKS